MLAALLLWPSITEAQQKRDTLANGIAYGALIGGASAFTFVTVAEARCGPGCEGADGPLALQAALGGAGIGGAIGLTIDLWRKPDPAAPSIRVVPIVGRRTRTLTVRLRW
jgi:hypothetical protein